MKTTIINKILLVLMLITAQQVSALEFQVDGIYYRTSIFTKNSAYVTHSGTSYTESVEYQGEVVIPESVTYNGKTYTIASIGGYAFAGCPGLTSVTIPNTVTTVNQNAFNGCTGLKTIECKATTPPALGDNAFTSYDATLVVPSSSESAYKSAAGWSNFKFKEEPSETPGSGENSGEDNTGGGSDSGEDSGSDNSGSDNTYGLACKILNSTDVAIIAGTEKYTGDIVIPSQVTISGKTYNVTSIANDAFKGCTGLTSITIPSSITSIGSSAFDSCNNLNKVNISDILSWCKITFANSLANPLYYAKKLYLNGTLVTKLEIPSAITEIKNYTFYNCTSISTIVFPSGILKIGNSAFVNCSNLTSVTIPNSVTTIDENAFNGCIGLTSLTIGSSVGSIGNYAFGNCTELKSVTSLNSTPPTCGTGVFQGVTISSIPLTVPAGSESLYKATYTWQDFKYKEESENPGDDPAVDTSGLKYNIISSTDVEVVAGTEKYTGDIVIPSQTTIDGKAYRVTGIGEAAFYGCSGLTSIIIPNSVTDIGHSAFAGCSGLTSITIPNNVTNIDNYAFKDCTNLTSITIPNNVTGIGIYAFASCSGLTSVIIGNSVTSIGESAFYNCDGLTSVTIPNSVTSIGEAAFNDCSGLTSVTIGNSVTSIGDLAFYDCNGLTSVTIPNSVTSIGSYAFRGCSGLTSVTIGNSVTSIGSRAFSGCSGLTSVTIPNSVTSIGGRAFEGCSGLTSVTIPNSVTSIGEAAFYYCSGLTSVTIPNSVTSIGEWAFNSCSSLTSVIIPSSVTSIGNSAFSGCSGLTSVISLNPTPPTCGTDVFRYVSVGNITLEVPAESVSLYQSADTWKDFGTIKGIVEDEPELPEGTSGLSYKIINSTDVEVIAGAEEYSGDIIIPSQTTIDGKVYSVTGIGSSAFYNCSGLTSVTIGNGVTSIGSSAFYGCSGLTSVTIGNSVTSIGNSAFYYCSGLTSVNISDLEAWCKIDFSTEYSNPLYYANNLYLNGELLTNIEIPNSITRIKPYAFCFCSRLTRVTIPNSVTSIGNYAFHGCRGLISVTIGNSVTSIGVQAFCVCNSLTSVTIGSSVTSIGISAFGGCSGLTSVTSLNPTPPTCGTNVFYNESVGDITLEVPNESVSLYQSADIWKDFGTIKGIESAEKSVLTFNKLNTTEVEVIAGSEKYSGDIVIPSKVLIDDNIYSVVSVANNAFQNCTGLTSIEISNNVKSIGNRAFSGCSSLVQAKIGDGVTSIGQHAFYDCKKMTDLTIGESVTSLESDAFNGCTNLSQIKLPNSLERIKSYAFQNCYGLKDIIIPDNVKTIEHYAFTSCSSLGCITLGKSVNSVGNLAFSNCKALNNVISLNTTPPLCDGKPFASENLALKTLEVPSESVSLYQSADTWKDFGTIKGVAVASALIYTILNETDVEVIAGAEKYTGDIVIPSQTTIDGKVYNVTKVGNKAFYECTGLTSVTIPNSVTSIGENAFRGCSGLTSITIPNSVTIIEYFAFYGCSGLTSVTSLNPTPPTCGTDVFEGVNVGNITLEVPSESVSLYQSADTWKDFGTITAVSSASRSESSGIDDVIADGDEVEYYNLHGVRIVNPTKGIYIKRQGGKTSKVVL